MKTRLLVIVTLCLVLALLLSGCPNNAAGSGGGEEPNPQPEKKFSVKFDANGGTGGLSEAIEVTLGQPMPVINVEKPKKVVIGETWYFTGYWDKQTGGKMFYGPDMHGTCPWDKEKNAALYAQYSTEPVFDRAYYENQANTVFNITTASQLSQIAALACDSSVVVNRRDFTGKIIILLNDIDFGNTDTEPNFNGIANGKRVTEVMFSGTFDGNAKKIINMRIDHSKQPEWACGLFGHVKSSAVIKNITLVSGYVKNTYIDNTHNTAAGSVAGINGGLIENCINESLEVTGYIQVGGLTGRNTGKIINSQNKASVHAKYQNAGGITGLNWNDGSIQTCTNFGTVTGTEWSVGGIAGANKSTIQNSTNSGKISSKNGVGGIVGSNGNTTESTGLIENCTNSGTVTGTDWSVGGIAGKNESSIQKSTNNGQINGISGVGGIAGSNGNDKITGLIENCTNDGIIAGTEWSIGGVVGENKNGTIKNCKNTAPVTGIRGLGGICGRNETNGTIENCINEANITAEMINGHDIIGGIAARNYGSIQSSHNSGTITGFNMIGGIAGWNEDNPVKKSVIENCTNSGTIISYWKTAGIAGRNFGVVRLCSNSGQIFGDADNGNEAGGIVGLNGEIDKNLKFEGIIERCYNTGTVNGKNHVGGIVGNNENGEIIYCYNTAELTADFHVGGIAGYMRNGNISNCYNIGLSNSQYFMEGIVGSLDHANINPVIDCYFLQTETINNGPQTVGTPKDITGFQLVGFGWDNSIWEQSNTAPEVNGVTSRPVLIDLEEPNPVP